MTHIERPYVLLSVAMSIDGYIDDASPARLLLSNDADVDRVDEVRAGADAILVGAGTVRADDPRLLVRSQERRERRVASGRPASPVKVTITGSGDIDGGARFFTTGEGEKIVYTSDSGHRGLAERLGDAATVVAAGSPVDVRVVLADLAERGIARLMVEGGGAMHTQLLTSGLVDELHVVIAPFFIGDPAAPRFCGPGDYPFGPASPLRLAETRRIGDVVLLRYLATPAATEPDSVQG